MSTKRKTIDRFLWHKSPAYTKGLNFYRQKPIYERLFLSIKEGRFKNGFLNWYDDYVFFYPVYLYHRLLKPKFRSGGKSYTFYISKSDAVTSERCLELPIAKEFIGNPGNARILEIGNVLSTHKVGIKRTVIDKYEVEKGVLNEDIIDYKPKRKFQIIISISTVEHVGWDEDPKDPVKIEKAMRNILSMLSEDGRLLITVPIGYNPAMDDYIKKTKLKKRFMLKTSILSDWREATEKEAFKYPFNSRYRHCNALAVITK